MAINPNVGLNRLKLLIERHTRRIAKTVDPIEMSESVLVLGGIYYTIHDETGAEFDKMKEQCATVIDSATEYFIGTE